MKRGRVERSNLPMPPSEFQPPGRWAWVPLANSHQNLGMLDLLPDFQQGMGSGNWPCPQPVQDPGTHLAENPNEDSMKTGDDGRSKSSSVKEESVKRRIRRTRKKEVEDESI